MWNEAYKQGLKPSANKLKKLYTNHIKPQYSWQSTLSYRVYQFAFMHLGEAFSLSRKQKGSNNRNKAKLKLAKAYQRVTNIRKDTIHK
jgi:putative transposase